MALNKQVHLYGIDTSCFYFKEELKLYYKISAMTINNSILKKKIKELQKEKKKCSNTNLIDLEIKSLKDKITVTNKFIKKYKNKFSSLLEKNKNRKRKLADEYLKDNKIISVFESTLTRLLGCENNEVTKDLFIIQTYFYQITESLIKNNFVYNGEEYMLYTSSAGQIRLKKFVMIKKSSYERIYKSLSCGLSIDKINENGGANTNKYLAYLALQNSATDLWENFDIDKSIVVDDFETMVGGLVDFIDYKTYEIKEKQYMEVSIPHTDGAGLYLPKVSTKNTMVRLPWVKGLLISTPYDLFIKEKNASSKVKDIYGKEWDVLEDDIQIIFTKSQFKMWKYYKDWDEYKTNYKLYKCQAGTCNEEVEDPTFARTNYQFLQTLTDITDEELIHISEETINNINNLGSDVSIMLKVLGANRANKDKNSFQEALSIYPEMLVDEYSRKVIKDLKSSLVKQAKSGKLFLDAHYSFISPDVYAFMEWLFLGIKTPTGLLGDGEVSCSLYKNVGKLDILRSPSLYREHAVRKNIINDDTKKWFTTTALYVSSHDLISKLLMFDVDGDSAQIVADEVFVSVAERNMKDIVPLHYEMKKAKTETINKDSLYNGLKLAYSNNAIGLYSNNITKVWNSDDVNLDVIKLLCLEVNYSIDSAKTLYFIERPEKMDNLISRYTKAKVPYFFQFAKNKEEDSTDQINKNSIMGRLQSLIPNDTLRFSKVHLKRFDYKMLLKNKRIIINEQLCEAYSKLTSNLYGTLSSKSDDGTYSNLSKICYDIRNELLAIEPNEDILVDNLVAYAYGNKKKSKFFIWYIFGDKILNTLKSNLYNSDFRNTTICDRCGKRIEKTSNKTKYCDKCQKDIQLEHQRKSMKKLRNVK